jgi:hypothetical protein
VSGFSSRCKNDQRTRVLTKSFDAGSFLQVLLEERRDAYLDSVKVGPTPHREWAIRPARMLLRKLELSEPDHMTTETGVPFRNCTSSADLRGMPDC